VRTVVYFELIQLQFLTFKYYSKLQDKQVNIKWAYKRKWKKRSYMSHNYTGTSF